jgi:hypothetical protein
MKRISILISIIIMSVIISSCCTSKKAQSQTGQSTIPGPKAIIYQTTKDYSKLVPIILSDDKKTIVSYPDVKDIYYNGNLAYPTQLHNGYLLDNRGINENVAFLNLTYEEYSKLAKTPTPEQLMKMVTDNQPLNKMYSCGIRSSFKDIESELNAKIDSEDFSAFVKLK